MQLAAVKQPVSKNSFALLFLLFFADVNISIISGISI
jgi:hypothetical protein